MRNTATNLSSDQAALINRLLSKLDVVQSTENVQQVILRIITSYKVSDINNVYLYVLAELESSLKREGTLQSVESVTPLINLLSFEGITDRLAIPTLIRLDYVLHNVKVKWACQHNITL